MQDGPYDTGFRIQCFCRVKEATGKSPQDFVQSFVDGKKKAAEIISQRPEEKQGPFTRIGIETKETLAVGEKQKTYRVLYSCFWCNQGDVVVILIVGTPPQLWEKYADTFDAMSSFDLLDVTAFGGTPTKPPNAGGKPPR